MDHSRFDAWVVYFDVFGFSARLEKKDDTSSRLESLHHDGHLLCEANGFRYTAFSDSIFCIGPVLGESSAWTVLTKIAETSSTLMTTAFRNDLPVRGSIAFGKVTHYENILLGSPVVRAVRSESVLPIPLLFVPAAEFQQPGQRGRSIIEGTFKYQLDVEVRPDGIRRGALVFPDEPTEFAEYAQQKYEQYVLEGPPHVAAAWRSVQVQVSKYLHALGSMMDE